MHASHPAIGLTHTDINPYDVHILLWLDVSWIICTAILINTCLVVVFYDLHLHVDEHCKQAGDSLVAVEGKDVTHLPVQEVAKLFAGKPGSVCTCTCFNLSAPFCKNINKIRKLQYRKRGFFMCVTCM
jgi:hypothetical protein